MRLEICPTCKEEGRQVYLIHPESGETPEPRPAGILGRVRELSDSR
jgi:hypothetical protein